MPPSLRTLRVSLPGNRGYEVVVGSGVLPDLGAMLSRVTPGSGRAFVAHDRNLPHGLVQEFVAALQTSGLKVRSRPVVAEETSKTLAALEPILIELGESRHERRDPVVALGGGIVGDVAGFAAAIYRRGVPVVQCPTTLLAMVDASVGGKTGVNLAVGGALKKNFLGSFHQPALVVADVRTLASLPDRALRAGLAECVKHGLLSADWGDPALLDWTEQNTERFLRRDPDALAELVARNVAVKAAVVAADEREEADESTSHGGRALLNLGHTFGHAIETIPGLSPTADASLAPLQHGEAVALGLVAAARTAEALGVSSTGLVLADRIIRLLGRIGLPTKVHGLPPTDQVLSLMADDKKVAGGRLRLVLPLTPGRCKVVTDPDRRAVIAGIDALRA